jgi:hypothetical protein
MTSEEATDTQQRKRTRFTETSSASKTLEPNASLTSPKASHKSFTSSAFVSLPQATLSLCLHHCDRYVSLQNRVRQQRKVISKFDSDQFMPKPACSNFKLVASKRVMETPRFKTLADNTNKIVDSYQRDLKAELKSVANLELDSFLQQIIEVACQAFKDFSDILLLQANPNSDNLKDAITLAHACILQNHQQMFEYLSTDPKEFWSTYLAQFYPDEQARLEQVQLTAADRESIDPLLPALNSLVTKCFVDSWNGQLTVYKEREATLAANTFARMRITGEATEETAQAMDLEAPMESPAIKDLIERTVLSRTKKLEEQINSLSQRLARNPGDAKNQNRGAKNARASQKNKSAAPPSTPAVATEASTTEDATPPTTSTRATQRRKPRDPAAAAANASSVPKRNGARKRSKPRRTNSNKQSTTKTRK